MKISFSESLIAAVVGTLFLCSEMWASPIPHPNCQDPEYIQSESNTIHQFQSALSGVDTTCPNDITMDANANVAHRSACPWYYRMLEFPESYPRFVNYAVSKCTDCVKDSTGKTGCSPIVQTMTLKNRTSCENGVWKYEKEWVIEIPVGYTCAGKRSAPASGTTTPSTPTGSNCKDTSCPTEINIDADAPVSKRSTCPWYYVMREFPESYPRFVNYAVSQCTSCVQDASGKTGCSPIMQEMTLKNRTSVNANGVWKYETDWNIEVPVGYTCAGLRMHSAVTQTPTPTTTKDDSPPDYY